MEHSLDTYPHIEPKVQKKKSLAPDKRKVVTDEVNEWLKADFKDLNKACPKDLYPFSEIDWKIKSLMGFQYKCFLDAYKGYHQIQMTKKDKEKTAFHMEDGVFCYTKMPFGLKNAGVTYQRLVNSAFKEHIGVNLEAYVDDMVIKSRTNLLHPLKEINMKLNPKKFSFGMEEGKFLGYIVTSVGIRANPKKTMVVMDMPSLRTLKQMQSLSGKLAALNRFLSKSAERSLPFLDTLKKCTNKKDFRWTEVVKAAFLEMKKLVFELPTLTTPKKAETLMMYLAAANEAVSTVLLTERVTKDEGNDDVEVSCIIMANVIPPNHVDDLPVVEPNQPDDVPFIPEPVLVDDDEDPKEEEFEEEEEPQEEEEDMDVDIKEDDNEPELTFPYEETNSLNPPPPAFDSESEDAIEVENTVEPKDETIPVSVYEVGESSTAAIPREDGDRLLPVFMRRDIDSLFGRIANLSRRLCGRETAHTLVEKKGRAKDKFYEKTECEKLKKELEEARLRNTLLRMQNERVERDLYWTRVQAHEFHQEMIRRGFVFEERPNEAIDVLVEDVESSSPEPQKFPHDA
ncbi:reverse transcriptase domain-containing protein [Tanacetum coccineum]